MGGYFHGRPWLRAAYLAVPREPFVPNRVWRGPRESDELKDPRPLLDRQADPERWLEAVYEPTTPLITQIDDGAVPADGPAESSHFTSSVSCSSVVVNMLHYLDPQEGDTVLEIGTGSGYNAALLAQRVAPTNVVSVEIQPDIAERAARTLRQHRGEGGVPLVVTGDGELGYPERAPYSRIISTVCVRKIPQAWLDQATPGAVIVTPMVTPFAIQALARLVADGKGGAEGDFVTRVSFMLARGQREYRKWSELGWFTLRDLDLSVDAGEQRIRLR
ncbi:rRNA adenine N-6-methyltransferase family protein [Streptomyces sp. NRRL F-5755]|uniref:rRNA adenine N-6-methyltransferase family protein n=1 Tax=Streptomyces sp. NRRL F-5755 TaxID=1519475 RepID=UPI000B004E88|nr:rRNA adenine N-6-methyltransferase family protein [Streptomyces sp. NRRL F-5755]